MAYAASELRKCLPNVNFEIEEYIRGDLTDNSKFVASLRVQLCSLSDVEAWVQQFSTLSKTHWIHRSSLAATESTSFPSAKTSFVITARIAW